MSRPYEKANSINMRSNIRYVPRPKSESKLPRKIAVVFVLGVVVTSIGLYVASKV